MLMYTSIAGQMMTREEIRSAAKAYLPHSIEAYKGFLRIPNIGKYEKDRNENVAWCVSTFEKLGFDTRVLYSEGIPHVFAERIYNPQSKSILFYLQIDGQPVDPKEWSQPDPFEPVLKQKLNNEWQIIDWTDLSNKFDPDLRIFSRSASDSKGPAMSFISALEILHDRGLQPDYNIKVIMDMQEEMGSPTLPALVEKERSLFDAELLLIMDGTRHLSNLPTLTFGARGIATVTLRVIGPRGDLHSGQYGNFAPNPVFKLARLIADMKDEEGRVSIPGFYEGVNLSEEEKVLINSLPEDLDTIRQTLGIAVTDQVGATYQEAMQYPSLNIRGLNAAWVGREVRTLIPSDAVAEIDMRLVLETPAERQIALLRDYIVSKGYHIVTGEPTDEERLKYPKLIEFSYRIGSKPFRTEIDSPIGRWLSEAMTRLFDEDFVKMRTTGGSQPMAPFISTLDIPAVSIRIPNPDNSIHAPDENMRLGNYLEGIEMCLSILSQSLD